MLIHYTGKQFIDRGFPGKIALQPLDNTRTGRQLFDAQRGENIRNGFLPCGQLADFSHRIVLVTSCPYSVIDSIIRMRYRVSHFQASSVTCLITHRHKKTGGKTPGFFKTKRMPQRSAREILLGKAPVNQAGEHGFHKLRTQVAIIDVVGVFPDVDAQQGLVAGGQRGTGSTHVDDIE